MKTHIPMAILLAVFIAAVTAQEQREPIGQISSPSISTINLAGPRTQEIDELVNRGIATAAEIAPDLHVDYRSALLVNNGGKLTIGLSLIAEGADTTHLDKRFILVSANGRLVHGNIGVDRTASGVYNLVMKEMDGNGVEFNRAENKMYRLSPKTSMNLNTRASAAPGTVGCIKQNLADMFKPCEAAIFLNEIGACGGLLAAAPETASVSAFFAIAPCAAVVSNIVQALACSGVDCQINLGNSAPAINDVNPKIIALNTDSLLTIDGQNFQPNFSAKVMVNGQTFPIYPGAQTVFVNPNRIMLWVKIGGPPASTQYSIQIVNPDNQGSNIYPGLVASASQQGGGGNAQLQISFSPSPVGPASAADCSRAYFFTVIVQNTGTIPITFNRLDVDSIQNLSLSQVGFPNQIGAQSQFQAGIKYCRDPGSMTWTLYSATGAAWSGTAQLLQ